MRMKCNYYETLDNEEHDDAEVSTSPPPNRCRADVIASEKMDPCKNRRISLKEPKIKMVTCPPTKHLHTSFYHTKNQVRTYRQFNFWFVPKIRRFLHVKMVKDSIDNEN